MGLVWLAPGAAVGPEPGLAGMLTLTLPYENYMFFSHGSFWVLQKQSWGKGKQTSRPSWVLWPYQPCVTGKALHLSEIPFVHYERRFPVPPLLVLHKCDGVSMDSNVKVFWKLQRASHPKRELGHMALETKRLFLSF